MRSGPRSPRSLAVADAPDPSFPCGTLVPGWGLASQGAAGELLVSFLPPNPLATLAGPSWVGLPAAVPVPIPNNPALQGVSFFIQGAFVDGTAKVGLTEAAQLVIGG